MKLKCCIATFKLNTALIWACWNKLDKEIILKLLDLNCNPKQINYEGKTALDYAIEKELDEEIINKIKEKMLI